MQLITSWKPHVHKNSCPYCLQVTGNHLSICYCYTMAPLKIFILKDHRQNSVTILFSARVYESKSPNVLKFIMMHFIGMKSNYFFFQLKLDSYLKRIKGTTPPFSDFVFFSRNFTYKSHKRKVEMFIYWIKCLLKFFAFTKI